MIGGVALLVCVTLFVLFDVRFRPEFSLPQEFEQPDPQQEARYEGCVDRRTDEATRQAFEQADNPDVQSLMIRMRQKEAIADCRREFPRRQVTVSKPFRFNLVDLQWRFRDPRSP